MKVAWYNIGNAENFEKMGIPQLAQELELEDLGMVEIVLIKGFNLSVIFNGEMMTPNLNGRNPFSKNKTTAYIDPITKDIWVGYEVTVQ